MNFGFPFGGEARDGLKRSRNVGLEIVVVMQRPTLFAL